MCACRARDARRPCARRAAARRASACPAASAASMARGGTGDPPARHRCGAGSRRPPARDARHRALRRPVHRRLDASRRLETLIGCGPLWPTLSLPQATDRGIVRSSPRGGSEPVSGVALHWRQALAGRRARSTSGRVRWTRALSRAAAPAMRRRGQRSSSASRATSTRSRSDSACAPIRSKTSFRTCSHGSSHGSTHFAMSMH